MTPGERVLLAVPDAATRAGLRLALERAGFGICGAAASLQHAVAAARLAAPEVVLLADDVVAPPADGVRRIADAAPDARIVVLTVAPDADALLAAVLAGADGYLAMDVDPRRLPAVVRAVAGGEPVLPRRLSGRILEELRGRDRRRSLIARRAGAALTDREWEVLQLLADGLRTSAMAARLGIAQVTVRRHVAAVVAKLGVRDRRAAAQVLRDRSRT